MGFSPAAAARPAGGVFCAPGGVSYGWSPTFGGRKTAVLGGVEMHFHFFMAKSGQIVAKNKRFGPNVGTLATRRHS